MGTVAKGVFLGGLPRSIIGFGAAVAVGVIILDSILEARGSKTRVPVMAFAVGVYLPFHLNVPIIIGGVIAYIVARTLDHTKTTPKRHRNKKRKSQHTTTRNNTGEA